MGRSSPRAVDCRLQCVEGLMLRSWSNHMGSAAASAIHQAVQQTRPNPPPERGGRPPSEAKVGGWGLVRKRAAMTPTRLALRADLPRTRGRYYRVCCSTGTKCNCPAVGTWTKPLAGSIRQVGMTAPAALAGRGIVEYGSGLWM